MCGGGSAPKAKPSAAEVQNARNAVDKFNERHQDGYVGLEAAAIQDANLNHEQPLRGIGSAEMAMQEGAAYSMVNTGRKALDFASVSDSVARSMSALDVDSGMHAQAIKDQKMLGVINTGQDKANNSAGAMVSAASNGLSKSLSSLQSELLKQQAKYNAIGQVMETGLAAGAYKMAKNQATHDPSKVEVREAAPFAINSTLDSVWTSSAPNKMHRRA